MEIGLPLAERNQIEGLQMRRAPAGLAHQGNQFALTEEQLSSRAIRRLAANPPMGVGTMQRRTIRWLLRPFPLGWGHARQRPAEKRPRRASARIVCVSMLAGSDLAART